MELTLARKANVQICQVFFCGKEAHFYSFEFFFKTIEEIKSGGYFMINKRSIKPALFSEIILLCECRVN